MDIIIEPRNSSGLVMAALDKTDIVQFTLDAVSGTSNPMIAHKLDMCGTTTYSAIHDKPTDYFHDGMPISIYDNLHRQWFIHRSTMASDTIDAVLKDVYYTALHKLEPDPTAVKINPRAELLFAEESRDIMMNIHTSDRTTFKFTDGDRDGEAVFHVLNMYGVRVLSMVHPKHTERYTDKDPLVVYLDDTTMYIYRSKHHVPAIDKVLRTIYTNLLKGL